MGLGGRLLHRVSVMDLDLRLRLDLDSDLLGLRVLVGLPRPAFRAVVVSLGCSDFKEVGLGLGLG